MIKQDYARRPSTARRAFMRGLLCGICILVLYLAIVMSKLAFSHWPEILREIKTNAGLQVSLMISAWGFALALLAAIADVYARGRRSNGSR